MHTLDRIDNAISLFFSNWWRRMKTTIDSSKTSSEVTICFTVKLNALPRFKYPHRTQVTRKIFIDRDSQTKGEVCLRQGICRQGQTLIVYPVTICCYSQITGSGFVILKLVKYSLHVYIIMRYFVSERNFIKAFFSVLFFVFVCLVGIFFFLSFFSGRGGDMPS